MHSRLSGSCLFARRLRLSLHQHRLLVPHVEPCGQSPGFAFEQEIAYFAVLKTKVESDLTLIE